MARIHMTRMAKLALYCLRIYLILLLGLIIVKFVLLFSKPASNSPPVSSARPPGELFGKSISDS
jgi:hypothetical protein